MPSHSNPIHFSPPSGLPLQRPQHPHHHPQKLQQYQFKDDHTTFKLPKFQPPTDPAHLEVFQWINNHAQSLDIHNKPMISYVAKVLTAAHIQSGTKTPTATITTLSSYSPSQHLRAEGTHRHSHPQEEKLHLNHFPLHQPPFTPPHHL